MLRQLKKLDVGYNKFSQIRLDNFRVNSGLTELKLNNWSINFLEDRVFTEMSN